jgi:hypothetical protein
VRYPVSELAARYGASVVEAGLPGLQDGDVDPELRELHRRVAVPGFWIVWVPRQAG